MLTMPVMASGDRNVGTLYFMSEVVAPDGPCYSVIHLCRQFRHFPKEYFYRGFLKSAFPAFSLLSLF
jgi:hypothetical protein